MKREKNIEKKLSSCDDVFAFLLLLAGAERIPDEIFHRCFLSQYRRAKYGFKKLPISLLEHCQKSWRTYGIKREFYKDKENIKLYRGAGVNDEFSTAISWTTSPEVAENFAQRYTHLTGKKSAIFEVIAPTSAIVNADGMDGTEKEILLMPGSEIFLGGVYDDFLKNRSRY